MTRLLDLAKVVPEDVEVELGDRKFRLPGDPPMEVYARMLDMQQRIDEAENEDYSERSVLEATFQAVLSLFQVHQPDLEDDDLRGLVGIHSAVAILGEIMSMYQEEENGDRPTETTRAPARSRKSTQPSESKRPTRASRS